MDINKIKNHWVFKEYNYDENIVIIIGKMYYYSQQFVVLLRTTYKDLDLCVGECINLDNLQLLQANNKMVVFEV